MSQFCVRYYQEGADGLVPVLDGKVHILPEEKRGEELWLKHLKGNRLYMGFYKVRDIGDDGVYNYVMFDEEREDWL